jgi:LmbE family N-acetylglucosaminyl deacetylase
MKFLKFNPFIIVALCILFGTTIFWSIQAALIYQYNADQIADPYLFTSLDTFTHSLFPAQHSFLVKWPLFLAVALFHNSPYALIAMTVITSLITVAALAVLLAKIEKRPAILALLYVALSSVLLGTTMEPSPGSLLPIGIGMLATRNIEYIIFLIATLLIIKGSLVVKKQKLTYTMGGFGLLLLLILSDQLFVPIAIGGAILLGLFSIIVKHTIVRKIALQLLLISLGAFVAAFAISALFQYIGLFVAASGAGGSPYGLVTSPKELVIAVIYGILGILSVFGANPVVGTLSAPHLPGAFIDSFQSISILTTAVNVVLFCIVLWGAWYIVSLLGKKPKPKKKKRPASIWYIYSTYLAACCIVTLFIFLGTKHYHPVDARYLSLFFFAGFVILAVFVSSKKFSKRFMAIAAAVLTVSCIVGMVSFSWSYAASKQAYASIKSENELIQSALRHHQVRTFAADYWRVYPIIQGLSSQPSSTTKPLPMDTCTQPRNVLTSTVWQKDAFTQSFAYLLTTEQTGTGFPACSLTSIKSTWGTPSDSLVISGTAEKPKTLLLFYDTGKNNHTTTPKSNNSETLLKSFSSLKDVSCPSGNTVVQTIAHQDDDILFMNPHLIHSMQHGDCIRTVYFTAGDAGIGQAYWLGREEGSKAAYAALFGIKQPEWRSRDIILDSGHQIKVSQLLSVQNRVTLIFLHLPDGNIDGSGFKTHDHQSISKLENGTITTIKTVDNTSIYTKPGLEDALVTILDHYQPSLVRTQALNNHSERFSDHNDHIVVGRVTEQAFQRYKQQHEESTIIHYIGYPVREQPQNVSGEDLRIKRSMFYAFALHDGATCISDEACLHTAYTYYLDRQYTE